MGQLAMSIMYGAFYIDFRSQTITLFLSLVVTPLLTISCHVLIVQDTWSYAIHVYDYMSVWHQHYFYIQFIIN